MTTFSVNISSDNFSEISRETRFTDFSEHYCIQLLIKIKNDKVDVPGTENMSVKDLTVDIHTGSRTAGGVALRRDTEEKNKYLKKWMIPIKDDPYPTEEEKEELMEELGMTLVQINNWMSNYRRRILKLSGPRKQRKLC